MRITYNAFTPITDIHIHKGIIQPHFGRGTGSGELSCPKCHRIVGHLIDIKRNLVIGFIDTECNNCNETIDYSSVNTINLNINVIPCWITNSTNDYKKALKIWDRVKQEETT